MWKFVSRRFKDTVERTYNVLDVRRNWASNVDRANDKNERKEATKSAQLDFFRGSRQNFKYKEYNQYNQYEQFHPPICEATFLSATIIGAYYFAQLFSLDRRRRESIFKWHRENAWCSQLACPDRDKTAKWLSVLEKSSVPSSNTYKELRERFPEDVEFARPVQINNDSKKRADSRRESQNNKSPNEVGSVDLAISHLRSTIGDIEFKLGLQNLQAHNPEIAVSHFKMATTHLHAGATFNLGLCFELGIGIEKNMKKAMECYRSASMLGHKKAMYNLGVFYSKGLGGLQKSTKAAHECFVAADKLGLKSARLALDIPTHLREPDNEIFIKSDQIAIDALRKVQQRTGSIQT